ncbi:MAG TPA: sigma-54 dependent transcriptional regulator [Polyangiaceae bacterium]|nr:sigma-54 dependent transcriptional regulator [Polyangiaceae bacterium]
MTHSATDARPSLGRVLLVDDEPDQVALLCAMLTPLGMDVATAESAEQAQTLFHRQPADVVVTDLNLPGASGIDLIRELRKAENPPAVVLITGEGSVGSAVEALKLGATDYLQKPVDPMRLVTLLQELLRSDDVREAGDEEDLPSKPTVFEGMVGSSARMREVFARIQRVAPTGAPVLIVGESGTGKELVARALHNRSRRSQGPFVPIHTGAIPRELVASELFGHEKGAFTGALTSSEGKFEAASGGTIFLDEVGTMDLSTQISLLRVLETYRFTRVGASKEREADVRVLAATNRDLLDLVEANQFREDLYYRLNVFTIPLPPLRERIEDIVPIAERFLRFFAKRYGTSARCLSDRALERLLAYGWPGNVRELRNVMEQTAVFAQREVVGADEVQFISTRIPNARSNRAEARAASDPAPTLPTSSRAPAPPMREEMPAAAPLAAEAETEAELDAVDMAADAIEPLEASDAPASPPISSAPEGEAGAAGLQRKGATAPDDHPLVLRIPVGTTLAEAERLLIIKTLEVAEGNKQRAARILGISRRGLYTKLASYGEHVPADETAAPRTADPPGPTA